MTDYLDRRALTRGCGTIEDFLKSADIANGGSEHTGSHAKLMVSNINRIRDELRRLWALEDAGNKAKQEDPTP